MKIDQPWNMSIDGFVDAMREDVHQVPWKISGGIAVRLVTCSSAKSEKHCVVGPKKQPNILQKLVFSTFACKQLDDTPPGIQAPRHHQAHCPNCHHRCQWRPLGHSTMGLVARQQ
jgi:hypothetical protein